MSTIFKLDSVAYFGEKTNHNNDISKKLAQKHHVVIFQQSVSDVIF